MEKDVINSIITNLKNMFEETTEDWDQYELELALRLLNCPFMEKKLKGLCEIKDIIECVNSKDLLVRKRYRALTPESLAKWIASSKVLEIVIENSHEELVKRISTLFAFVAEEKELDLGHIDLLWRQSQGRHDSLLIAVYQVIIDLTPYLTFPQKKYFFEKMKQVNPEDYDEKYLKMVTDFSIKTINPDKQEFFAVPLMFDVCMDNAKAKLHSLAIEYFVEMLKVVKIQEVVWGYLEKALASIKNNEAICQSMLIIQKVMQGGFIFTSYKLKEDVYKRIDSHSDGVVRLIINSFDFFLHPERKSAYSSTKNIKIRLQFWKFTVRSRFYEVKIDDIVDLWTILQLPEFPAKAQAKFLKTLLKLIKIDFTPNTNSEILHKLFLHPDFSAENISKEAFDVYFELFLRVNNDLRCIEMKFDGLHSRISTRLISYQCLIHMIFYSKSEEIVEKASKLLISLNIKLGRQLMAGQEEIWNEFLKILHEFLTRNEDSVQVYRALRIILQFLDNASKREEILNPNCTVAFKQAFESDYNKLYANYNVTTLGVIRKKVTEHYKKPLSCLYLVSSNNERYDALYDDLLLSNLKAPYVFIADFNQARQKTLTPSVFFASCQFFQESLLELLPFLTQANGDLAWTILSKVPLLQKYVSQFHTFALPFAEFFATSSLYRLTYNLKIIETLTRDSEWLKEFITKNGIENLLAVYLDLTFESDSASLTLEYNTIMMSILSVIIRVPFEITENLIIQILNSLIQAAISCKENEESGSIAKNAKDIFYHIKANNLELYLSTIRKFPIKDLFLASFLNCSCKYFSTMMVSFFLEQSQRIPELNLFFLNEMIGIFDSALLQYKSESYWDLLSFFINECEVTPDLKEKYLSFIGVLDSLPSETSGKDQNPILSGIIKVLKTVIEKINICITEPTVTLVLHKCLFEIPTKQSKEAPKCKNSMTRKEAFDLLKVICKQSNEALVQVLQYLSVQHQDPNWRTSKHADWNYHPRAHEKSSTGYVGVKNPGCICYIISSLQQLFFVEHFRETVLRIDQTEEPLGENLLYQLQNLYSALKNSDKQHVNARGICKSFKDWEGRPVNVMEQMDADEFINTFMDRIETQIRGGFGEEVIKEIFTGQLATELIGKNNCTHRSEVNEAFITLSVQVKNKKNLLESLESFKEGELLEGSNAYQCDHCENKVTALRRVCIKYLPNVLFITLRRFEFDYDKMKRVKVNDYCEFPMEISMENFTQEGIERFELAKEKEIALSAGQEFNKEIPSKKYPDDYYQYRLRGIVIHVGTADSGHYYSLIKEKNQWFEFNDTVVRKIDPSEIPNEAFGGEEKFTYQTQTGNSAGFKSKLRNAYILLYERNNLYRYHKDEEILRPLQYTYTSPEKEFLEVKEENERYWRCKSSFGYEYFDFILALLCEKKNNICRFGVSFFLTVLIRSRDNLRIATCVQSIREHLKVSKENCEWLLEMISYKNVLKELLMDCPSLEKRRVIVGLVHSAMKNVDVATLETFIIRLLSNMHLARKPHSFNFSQYFELIYRTLKLYTGLIEKFEIVTRLVNYLKRLPLDPIEADDFKFTDIYLGYNTYTPTEEKSELSISEFGTSLVFLINSLQLCVGQLQHDQVEFFFEDSILALLLNDAGTRYGGKVIGQFYATLCANNKTLTLRYGKFLVNGIDKSNFDKHKPYMRQLFWLLANSDNIVQEKLDSIMQLYLTQITNNKKYPMATESSIDFFIKAISKISALKEWVYKRTKVLRWLENVLGEPVVRNLPKSKEPITEKNPVARLEALRAILRGTFNDKDWEDSESEFLEEHATQGSKVEIYDFETEKWVTCLISISIGELIWVKSESEGINKWVDNLSDLIRPSQKKKGIRKINN